jgi:hypothetical protein
VNPIQLIRAGDPLSSQVKVVCGDCNSGWLNRIQEAARPLLLPLFEGSPHTIDAVAQAKVSTWIAMATMTGEYMSQEERRVTVSQADRSWFMAHSEAPSNWSIWIGRYRWHRSVPQSSHLSLHVLDSDTLPEHLVDEHHRPNTQTTSFCVGQLFAYAMSSQFSTIPRGWDWRTASTANTKLHRIWPIETPEIIWPPAEMTDAEAESYPVAFVHYMDNLALRVGYTTPHRAVTHEGKRKLKRDE